MNNILDTGIKNARNVGRYIFGSGSVAELTDLVQKRKGNTPSAAVFLIDSFFETNMDYLENLPLEKSDLIRYVSIDEEPTTESIDSLVEEIASEVIIPSVIVGIGGGITLDTAKAVSNLLTNGGKAADYQGWDLVRFPGIYKIGIPTLSGTGAEVSRTTVLTGPEKKLGINSDYTLFDQMVLDPELIADVPKDQWFYTGMDCYIHDVESLEGTYLNEFSRAYGEKSIELCRQVFLEDHPEKDDKLMMASLFGGMSIAYSQVGACHALSYGLSFVLGTHHGIGCCITFDYLDDVYPQGVEEFRRMMSKHNIELPRNLTKDLSDQQFDTMVKVALGLAPLWENCFGPEWQKIMTYERAIDLYKRM